MSDPKTQEPSMEEILASIRRIISEDGTPEGEAKPAEAAPAAAPPPPPPPVAAAAAPPPPPPPRPQAQAAPAEDVLELTEPMDEVVNLAPQEEERIQPLFDEQRGRAQPPPPPVPRAPFEGLVSPPQADQTVSSFMNLHDALSGPETPIGAGYKTLEQMTVEVMRPMLKEWLDTRLPSMVERLVQEEIERMVHRATQPRR
jgi:cell pole-organizing protein PopZ